MHLCYVLAIRLQPEYNSHISLHPTWLCETTRTAYQEPSASLRGAEYKRMKRGKEDWKVLIFKENE